MKSWGSDSSTHSHGVTHLGERERARAERTCPGTFPPPGLAGAALLTQGPGKGRGGEERRKWPHLGRPQWFGAAVSPSLRVANALKA